MQQSNINYEIEITPLSGADTKILNATINALRADNFINFSHHFNDDFEDFFGKCVLIENDKKIDLSIAYKKLNMSKLKELFNSVLKTRKQELKEIFEEKELSFNELSELDKRRYFLLYAYGEKIGGYNAIATMSITELLKVEKFFGDIYKELNKSQVQ
jgi:hypothetical protein